VGAVRNIKNAMESDLAEVDAHAIVDQFNTWYFKREQPKRIDLLIQRVVSAINAQQPVPFILYWGKGDRDIIGNPERQAINFLEELDGRVKELYQPGCSFTLILTDTHAKLNGFSEESIQKYYQQIESLAKEYNFNIQYISQLTALNYDALVEDAKNLTINQPLHDLLINMSKKHFKRSENYELGAILYYLQNQIEKKIMDQTYSNTIFITYNGSELNDILPDNMPIFYMYSLQKGVSIKPWFIER
jgi:hypothetical protein